jgi:hypothetical protein
MATAHVPGEKFDFSKITLQDPTAGGGRGGGYFSKAVCDGSRALLFQTTPSFSKAGVASTSRSNHIDIIVDKDSELATWLGELEAHMLEEITQNASKWFTSPMTSDEINYLLVPASKMYKNQMYMRATLPVARYAGQGKSVSVFDESENPVPQADILDSTRFIGVIEVAGMRFTTTAMRLELVLKQIMVLGDTTSAQTCLVRRPDAEPGQVANAASYESSGVNSVVNAVVTPSSEDMGGVKSEGDETVSVDGGSISVEDANASEEKEHVAGAGHDTHVAEPTPGDDVKIQNSGNRDDEDGGVVGSSVRASTQTLEEVVVETPIASTATIDLKDKSDVYQDLYEELYTRARDAKRYAIKLYLEAQELQTEHALDAIESSDDESGLEDVLH